LGQILIGGLTTGAVYALIAIGMSLVYSISRVINLAQGGFVVLAALLAVTLQSRFKLPFWLDVPAVILVLIALHAGLELLVIRPAAYRATPERMLLVTVGVLQATGGLLLLVWGNQPYTMAPFTGFNSLLLANLLVPTQALWVWGALAVSVAGLWLMLHRTSLGLVLRATAESPTAARLMGVDADLMRLLAFVIAGAMAALAGTTVIPLTFAGFETTVPYAVNGFIAAVLGGLGRVWAAVSGGVLLGVLVAVFGRYTSGTLAEVLAIALLIVLLLVRPSGLFGVGEVRR
jgi:branched-subunit amino acid ABC-type transport system permease component